MLPYYKGEIKLSFRPKFYLSRHDTTRLVVHNISSWTKMHWLDSVSYRDNWNLGFTW